MATLPLFLDTTTGRLRASASDDREVSLRAIAQNDIVQIGLTLVTNDAAVTATLMSGATLIATLRRLGDDYKTDTPLAQATTYSVSVQVATFTLDLTASAVAAEFDDIDAHEMPCVLEIRITGASSAWRHSWRIPVSLARAVYSAS